MASVGQQHEALTLPNIHWPSEAKLPHLSDTVEHSNH